MEVWNFRISFPQTSGMVQIHKDSTVGELVDKAANLFKSLNPNSQNRFLTLISQNKNEVIDSYLSEPTRSIKALQNYQDLKAYVATQNISKEKMDLSLFEFIKCIGKGGTSTVYLVRSKVTGKSFALKQLHKSLLKEPRRLEQILLEKNIMKDLDHPFIAKLHASFESKHFLNFLMEFYPGGELFFHLQKKRLSEEAARFYFSEILLTIEFLHKKKPENLLLDLDGHVRLTDFGLSKVGLFGTKLTSSFCGSPEYMAPEIVSGIGYSYSVDFYTIGALLHEFMTGLPPFYDSDPDKILKKVLKEELRLSSSLNPRIVELLSSLLEKNPKKRVNAFDRLKKSEWLNGVNWEDLVHKRAKAPISINFESSNIHPDFINIEVPTNSEENFIPQVTDFYFLQNSSKDEIEKKVMIPKEIAMKVDTRKSFEEKSLDSLLARYKYLSGQNSVKASNNISFSRNKSPPQNREIPKENISLIETLHVTQVESKGMNLDKIKRAFSPNRLETKPVLNANQFQNFASQKAITAKFKPDENLMKNVNSQTAMRVPQAVSKTEAFVSSREFENKSYNNKKAFFESKIRSSIEQLRNIQNERYKKVQNIIPTISSPQKTEFTKERNPIQNSYLKAEPSHFFNSSRKENFMVDRIMPTSTKASSRNLKAGFNSSIAGSFIGPSALEREFSARKTLDMQPKAPSAKLESYRSGIFGSFKENEPMNNTKFNFASDMKGFKPIQPMSAKNLHYNRRMFM